MLADTNAERAGRAVWALVDCPDEAVAHYSVALKADPLLAQAHNNLGVLLVQQEKLAEGTAQLREALRLTPNDPEPEYNLALGDRRAKAAQEFLVQIGVPAERLAIISYGQERPVCTDHDENCWQKNRRAHLSASN